MVIAVFTRVLISNLVACRSVYKAEDCGFSCEKHYLSFTAESWTHLHVRLDGGIVRTAASAVGTKRGTGKS